jgi:oligosaccharide repeat unit polymerase
VGLSACGVFFGLAGLAVPAYIAAIFAGAGLFFIAGRQQAGYSSLTVIFVFFFLSYGLIAPLGVFAGSRVFLPPPYLTDIFLAHFCLACGGLVLGVLMGRAAGDHFVGQTSHQRLNAAAVLNSAIILAGVATLFEAINVYRAGGLGLVLGGKLVYQSAVTALTGTLPSEYAARAAIAMLALWISVTRGMPKALSYKRALAFLVIICPVVATYIYLGRRTEILALIMILFVAGTWTNPVRRLTPRLVLSVATVYLAFVIVMILRETVFHPDQGRITTDYFAAVGLHALLPTRGEFGAPFSVFSEYLNRAGAAAFLWGKSYLDGFALVVPSFLYPGEKPVQLDVAFYTLINAGTAKVPGGIAGYGYSPILEAYVNFGSIGVVLVFFLTGLALTALERLRVRTGVLTVTLLYLMVLPMGQQFHRSTFGNAVLSPGLWIVITVIFAVLIYRLALRFVALQIDEN